MKKYLPAKIFFLLCFISFTRINAQMIVTVAGNGTQGYSNDGIPATLSKLNNPYNISVDGNGNIYIADYDNHRIRKVQSSTGIISTIAGTGVAGYSGDSGLAVQAKIYAPRGIAVDGAGNVYFCDQGNFRIRKINSSDGKIYTVAGTGVPGYSGNGGPAIDAMIRSSHSLRLDAQGNLVIADTWNHCVRKITFDNGIIRTIIGTGAAGFSGDSGLASMAQLRYPTGIGIDAVGNIYITDQENNRVRKMNAADSLIYTVAGNGNAGYTFDNISAISSSLNYPVGVGVDAAGSIYIADSYNERVRKVDPMGIITTLAGTGTYGYNGDSISCYGAMVNGPSDIVVDANGNVYFCDAHNFRIRKIRKSLVGINEAARSDEVSVYPNPASFELRIDLRGFLLKGIQVTDAIGKIIPLPYDLSNGQSETILDVSAVSKGIYFVILQFEAGTITKKFTVQ